MRNVLYFSEPNVTAKVARVTYDHNTNLLDLQILETAELVYNIPRKGTFKNKAKKLTKNFYPCFIDMIDEASGFNSITK